MNTQLKSLLKGSIDAKSSKTEIRYAKLESDPESGDRLIWTNTRMLGIIKLPYIESLGIEVIDNPKEHAFTCLDIDTGLVRKMEGVFPNWERIVPHTYSKEFNIRDASRANDIIYTLACNGIMLEYYGKDTVAIFKFIESIGIGKTTLKIQDNSKFPITIHCKDVIISKCHDTLDVTFIVMPITQ